MIYSQWTPRERERESLIQQRRVISSTEISVIPQRVFKRPDTGRSTFLLFTKRHRRKGGLLSSSLWARSLLGIACRSRPIKKRRRSSGSAVLLSSFKQENAFNEFFSRERGSHFLIDSRIELYIRERTPETEIRCRPFALYLFVYIRTQTVT